MNTSFSANRLRKAPVRYQRMAIRRMSPIGHLLLAVTMIHSIARAEGTDLVSFDEPNSAGNWISVNDGVMGGVSEGTFQSTDANTLLFTGTLSLENNGGFASIRTQPRAMDLSSFSGVAVKVRGDGRTYWIELRGARQMGATSYRAYLPTVADQWTETAIPFSDFKLQSYGRPLNAAPIDPSSVYSVGFMLADKNAGPFELEIESVKAVSEDNQVAPVTSGNTIVDVAASAGVFKTLLAAATAADLADVLSGDGPFTVLAPSDAAFAQLPEGTVAELLKPENKSKLAGILKYHVIKGRITLARALELQEGTTLQGAPITAMFEEGRVKIGPATLLKSDIAASNGIIHVIDQVLLPPESDRHPLAPTALIELAIDRGIPLFNHGNPGACAAVYEITCQALRTMPTLCEHSQEDLSRALEEIRPETSAREKAWTLRHALDQVYSRLAADD